MVQQMNIIERVKYMERLVSGLNEIPTEKKASDVVTHIMVEPIQPVENHNSHFKEHYAKMTTSYEHFKETFPPDSVYITCLEAGFFGYEVRYEHNGVIVDCLMTEEQAKDFYGDIRLARVVLGAERIK